MRVYIAGSSDELVRALYWSDRLRAAGVDVVSTWPGVIAAVGAANPRDATRAQRRSLSGGCLQELATADVLWMLAPAVGHGRGAYAELGAAHALGKRLVASGDTLQSVFAAQAIEYASDEDAFAALVESATEPHHRHLAEMQQVR